MPFAATWMDLEIIIVREVKSHREREISYMIYTWNEFTKQKQNHSYRKQTYG